MFDRPIPQPKTIFLHIIKTGGMTFRRTLQSLYAARFHVIADPALPAVEQALAAHDCVEFHIAPNNGDWIQLHQQVAQQDRWDLFEGHNLFTMLREPVDQILSNFFFMQSVRTQVEPVMQAAGLVFPETLDQFLDNPCYCNNQTAFLVAKSQQPTDLATAADLTHAIDLINRLHIHIGLTERYSDSMRVFESVTGLRVDPAAIRIMNRNASRPAADTVPQRTRDRIRSQSQLDLALYTFALDAFEQDLARHTAPPRAFSFDARQP
jgi:hypothetical protein